MKYSKHLFTIILSVSIMPGFTQNRPVGSPPLKNKSPSEASLFLFTAGYRIPVNKNSIISSGHGIYVEGGINPGKLISKKLVVGFYIGMAFQDRFWKTSFDQNFSNEYNASIKKDQGFSRLDSAVVFSSADLIQNTKNNAISMPGCATNSFHNYSLYYGTMIRLPFKYVPILKLYTGITATHYQGEGNIITYHKDYNILELKRVMYGCEMILFKGIQIGCKNNTSKSSKNAGALSIYYESCNFTNSSLYFTDGTNNATIQLKTFTSSSFLDKYKKEVTWGLKASFYIM